MGACSLGQRVGGRFIATDAPRQVCRANAPPAQPEPSMSNSRRALLGGNIASCRSGKNDLWFTSDSRERYEVAMPIAKFVTVAASLALLLGACAKPAVRPILPEPTFNKYGDVALSACRPESQPTSPIYDATLPTCESFCLPGEQPNYNDITHVSNVPTCVPIRKGSNTSDGGQPPIDIIKG